VQVQLPHASPLALATAGHSSQSDLSGALPAADILFASQLAYLPGVPYLKGLFCGAGTKSWQDSVVTVNLLAHATMQLCGSLIVSPGVSYANRAPDRLVHGRHV